MLIDGRSSLYINDGADRGCRKPLRGKTVCRRLVIMAPLAQKDCRKACASHGDSAAELMEAHAGLAGYLENVPDAVLTVDDQGRIVFINTQAVALFGYAKEELLGQAIDVLIPEELRSRHSRHLAEFFKAPHARPMGVGMELLGQRKDGSRVSVEIGLGFFETNGRTLVVCGIRDITKRKRLEARLRESEELYSSTVELSAIGIAHVAADGRFMHVNRQLCEMLGYTKEELLRLTVKQISHPEDVDKVDEIRAGPDADRANSTKIEKRYLRKDGATIWARVTISVKRDADGKPLYDIAMIEDISDRKAAEQHIRYLATHDDLTALPNRAMFGELLDRVIESARRYGRQCAVLFIDLDRFKIINDSLGHDAGDILLKKMASRLDHCMRSADTVARFGGDEFIALLGELADPSGAAEVARKILSAVPEPVDIRGQECRVTASIGIATYPRDATDAPTLMRHADTAMYRAKEAGRNNFQFYSDKIDAMSTERLGLETRLAHALERHELSIRYQPKVDIATGAIRGAEALLRWRDQRLGELLPARFIPLAEDTRLIAPIGKWVLQTACEQNVAWQRQGLPPIVMAVNLSSRQFNDSCLLNDIAEVLDETGMRPELLELEITETMIMDIVDQAAERAAAIKNLGVRLAIDDFGTGHSSLSKLKRFPIDTLKIDRSFIRDIPASKEDMAIAETIISLGKTLGISVVAEGVENAQQQAFLRELGCDEAQGFYFGKPCSADEFAGLMDRGDAVPARRAVKP